MPQNPQIFGAGVQGRSPVVSSKGRVNAYVEIEKHPDRSYVTFYGLPGLTEFADLGDTPIRGLFSFKTYQYAVHRGNLYQVRNDGVAVDKGDLDTTEGRVYFAANNSGEIIIVDGTSGYIYDTVADSFAKITDGDFPANPRTVAFSRTYFIVNHGAAGRWVISGADDGTTWDALDFSTADASPDELEKVHVTQGVLGLLGTDSMEFWGFTGNADFPFGRITNSRYGFGLAARASVVDFASGAMGLLRDNRGQIVVGLITGAEPVIVSPPDLTEIFSAYTTLNAVGTAYQIAGHPFYQINFPTDKATWIYDGMSQIWSERRSYDEGGIFRGLVGDTHQGDMYFGDYANGKIWKQSTPTVDGTLLDFSNVVWIEGQDSEGTDRPVEFELRSQHIHMPGNKRFTVPAFQVDMAEGEGTATGQGVNPKAMLAVSKDMGRSWGAELHSIMGKVGEYRTRVRWTRLGQFRDVVFRLRVTDPVPRIVTGEALEMRGGA